MAEIAAIFAKSQYVVLDFDRLVYHARDAAIKAAASVKSAIAKRYDIIPYRDLYSDTLHLNTDVLDDMTRWVLCDYRKPLHARIERLREQLGFFREDMVSDADADVLYSIYENSFRDHLTTVPGVTDLCSLLKMFNRKIIMVTESRREEANWVIDALELGQYVHFVASTHYFGPKADSLFFWLLESCCLDPREMVYLGCRMQWDIISAKVAGIESIYVNEGLADNVTIHPARGIVSVKSLHAILDVLLDHGDLGDGESDVKEPVIKVWDAKQSGSDLQSYILDILRRYTAGLPNVVASPAA